MITLGIVIAAIILIALLRAGVAAEYSEGGITVTAIVGPLRLKVLPQKVKPVKKDKKARKAKKAKKKKEAEKPKKPGKLKDFYRLLPAVKTTLSRFRRRLLIKKLTIHFTAADSDPVKTALTLGTANAVFGAIVPVLENNFRIGSRDLQATADFTADEPQIYVNAAISLAVWEAVYIAFGMLPAITGRK